MTTPDHIRLTLDGAELDRVYANAMRWSPVPVWHTDPLEDEPRD